MNNHISEMREIESIINGIVERENIICNYQKNGLLDRNDAIKKIIESRLNVNYF